jgi:hypothetical protein
MTVNAHSEPGVSESRTGCVAWTGLCAAGSAVDDDLPSVNSHTDDEEVWSSDLREDPVGC